MNFDLLKESKKIIVALSGGKDSSCALYNTIKYCQIYNKILHSAVIVNHNLRPSSAQEAIQIKKYWKNKKIKVVIIHWKNPIKNQNKARQFRLLSLSMYATRYNIDTIVLGHNLEDKIETFLMRERNSSFWGLSSIAPITYIYGIKYIRPLLYTSIDFIRHFIQKNNLYIIEDNSNATNNYTRNIIRHNILPKINIRECLININHNIHLRIYYQDLIEKWIKLHLIIVHPFLYKIVWNRLPFNIFLKHLIIKYIIEKLRGRQGTNFPEEILNTKRNFHINDCIFKHQGNYTLISEIIPQIIMCQEGLWHHKILVIDLQNKNRPFIFFALKLPLFQFNNIIYDLSLIKITTLDNFLIKHISYNFYSLYNNLDKFHYEHL
jgi:tRNA(Ile)-lysidine synthetase-like protein